MKEYPVRLEVQGVSAGYGKEPVISGADFTVRAGEILALIGPNGAGKSTLLKSIALRLAPMTGVICLNGKDLTKMTPGERAQKMSVLLTGQPETEWMTCTEMVSQGRYPYTGRLGILSDKDKAAVKYAMERMSVLELAEKLYCSISDGQKQRVLLARALAQEPEVLVLDEPTSYLDIRYQLELMEALRSLAREEQVAVVVSLHELELARRYADRILCIREGCVDKAGTPQEIFSSGYVEKLFEIPYGSLDSLYGNAGGDPVDRNAANYVTSDGRRLRTGYTTGTCAALASAGAATRLLTGIWPDSVSLVTPKGIRISVPLLEKKDGKNFVSCGVRKDAGDDIDCTDGALICAQVRLSDRPGIRILGGEGVGRVTKPGLDQPVGEAAINSVPRRMITEAVSQVCSEADYDGGIEVAVFVPGGEELAKKTFNPRLGITGGISILGTSGIVEPMSRQALIDTITLELRQQAALGKRKVILTPGNIGMDFIREQGIEKPEMPVVKCSNFIGEAIDECVLLGFEEVLIVGHGGKLVKLAGGIFNTHSRQADCRREIFCAHAALCGASKDICGLLMKQATTDACVDILEREILLDEVMYSIMKEIQGHLKERSGEMRAGAVLFFNDYKHIYLTEEASGMLGR